MLYTAQPKWQNGSYHPVSGLMPSPLKRVPMENNGWYGEEWATPYMAAVARVVFHNSSIRTPDVTLTPQPPVGAGLLGIIGKLFRTPDVTLTPQPVSERFIIGGEHGLAPESPATSPQTGLGAKPELSEWFKENRSLVIVVVIVALVVLFFFLKKGRR